MNGATHSGALPSSATDAQLPIPPDSSYVSNSSTPKSSGHASRHIADARRRQFLEDISHELRTPATAIRGEAELALRGGDKPAAEYKLALERVISLVRQMSVLIDDVLLLANVEAEPTAVRRIALPWIDTLREAARLAQALGHEQHVEVQFCDGADADAHARDPVLARGDPDRLRQALLVLLDNAVRYSHPRGRVTLDWAADGDRVHAYVRDHGIGIASDELPSLFVRYARGARARAHRADGSGLGLAIVQAIVQAHGGSIDIASEPGRGTTVRISVPRWPRGQRSPR